MLIGVDKIHGKTTNYHSFSLETSVILVWSGFYASMHLEVLLAVSILAEQKRQNYNYVRREEWIRSDKSDERRVK